MQMMSRYLTSEYEDLQLLLFSLKKTIDRNYIIVFLEKAQYSDMKREIIEQE